MVVCDFSGKTNEFASEVIQQMSRAKGWADKSFEVMGRSVACAIGLRLAEDKSWCSSFGTVPLTTDASRERTVVLTGQENPPFSCRASSCNFPFEGACIAAHHTLQKVNAFNEPSRTSLLQRFRGAALFVRVNGWFLWAPAAAYTSICAYRGNSVTAVEKWGKSWDLASWKLTLCVYLSDI